MSTTSMGPREYGRMGQTPEILVRRLLQKAADQLADRHRQMLRVLADGARVADIAADPELCAVMLARGATRN